MEPVPVPIRNRGSEIEPVPPKKIKEKHKNKEKHKVSKKNIAKGSTCTEVGLEKLPFGSVKIM